MTARKVDPMEEILREIAKGLGDLSYKVGLVAHGGQSGPAGLEMLSMSMAGEGLGKPVGDGLVQIAYALEKVAEAVADLDIGTRNSGEAVADATMEIARSIALLAEAMQHSGR